jgi:uncharacterized protein (DUF1778 family)
MAQIKRILADCMVFTLDEAQWNRLTEILGRPSRVPAGLKELFSRPSVFE